MRRRQNAAERKCPVAENAMKFFHTAVKKNVMFFYAMQHAKKRIKKNKDNRFLMHTGCIRMCVAAESQRNCTVVHCVKKMKTKIV